MLKILRFASALALLTSIPLMVEAADLSGTWKAKVDLTAGSGEPTFVFKQDGDKLTGTYEGTFGSAEVVGMVKGDQVEFSFDISGQKAVYKGKVSGEKMEGKCDYGPDIGDGTWSAVKVK